MKLKIIKICCIFLLGTYFLKADENSDFELLLQQEKTLATAERISLLDKYIKTHVGQHSALAALIIKQCVLINSNVETSQIEKTLNDIMVAKPNDWEAIFAKYTLLNLMHVDGQNEKVVQLGEPMLKDSYFDVFDKNADPQLLLLKKYYPFTSQSLKEGLIEQLLISYKHLELFEHIDHETRITELQQQLAALQANNNQQRQVTAGQSDVFQSQPALKNINPGPDKEQPVEAQRSPAGQLPLLIGVLAASGVVGVWLYFRK
jgi:hypothetical protein